MIKKKDNEKKKIILWEGFRKELPWILFWILIGIMSYGYSQDKKICDEILADPCDACYKLDQILIDQDYSLSISDQEPIQYSNDIYINESIIPLEDKNPNSRTITNYRE